MGAFALAAGMNTGSVFVEQRWRVLSRVFGGRAWEAHLALITPVWVAAVVQLCRLDPGSAWPLPRRLRGVGVTASPIALALWTQTVANLGLTRFANGACFGRAGSERLRGGTFRLLRNPIYDSYALALLGAAFRKHDARFLLLALESFVLLNLIEAPIEERCLTRA